MSLFNIKGPVILSAEPEKGNLASVYIQDIKLIPDIIKELPYLVFYVTNEETEFLICLNDHDYLIGCGTAFDWVEQMENND